MVRPLVPRNWRLQPPSPASPSGFRTTRFGGGGAVPSDHPNKYVVAARKRRITLSKVSIAPPKEDD